MTNFEFRLRGHHKLLTVEDYRLQARRKLPRMVWSFIDGGADGENTLRANRTAFDQFELNARVLTGAGKPGTAAKVADAQLSMPVFLAPTGMTGLVHWSGEPAAARAAELAGTRAVVSTAASYTIEEVAAATTEQPFFQLYPVASQDVGESLQHQLVNRAGAAGCGALFVTVDLPVGGRRLREIRDGMGIPPVLTPVRAINAATRPSWSYGYLRHQRVTARMLVADHGKGAAIRSARVQQSMMQPGYSWEDIRRLRDLWPGQLIIKGILHPEDAEKAVGLGLDGVMVSNHGGRQLDFAPSSLTALETVAHQISGRVPVYFDGGIRTGTDIIKALALGATAVAIGRPYLYGLAVAGEQGVLAVLELLREELVRALTLMGVADISELDGRHITRVQAPASFPA